MILYSKRVWLSTYLKRPPHIVMFVGGLRRELIILLFNFSFEFCGWLNKAFLLRIYLQAFANVCSWNVVITSKDMLITG
jgi:hypothetical protein